MSQQVINLSDYQISRDIQKSWELLSLVSCACDKYDMSHIADKYLSFPEFENRKIHLPFFQKTSVFMAYSFLKGAYTSDHVGEGVAVALHTLMIDLEKYCEHGFCVDTFDCKLRIDLKGEGKFVPLYQLLDDALKTCKDKEISSAVERYWLFLKENDENIFDLQKLIFLFRTIDFIQHRDCDLFECQLVKKCLHKIELMVVEHFTYEKDYLISKRLEELL